MPFSANMPAIRSVFLQSEDIPADAAGVDLVLGINSVQLARRLRSKVAESRI